MEEIVGFTRRSLLKLLASLAAAASFGRATAQEAGVSADSPVINFPEGEREVLVRILELLFPHQGIDASIYPDMAQHVIDVAGRNMQQMSNLGSGLQRLSDSRDAVWLQQDREQQSRALESLADSEFFAFIRINALEYLYRDPRAWEVVGYEGSALEYGGYIDRGFNDIDWLPES